MKRTIATATAAVLIAGCQSEPAPVAGVDDPALDNDAWLERNALADGVVVAESGLQYVVVQEGLPNGATADPGQRIAAHYHGTFRNGEVFDSSYDNGSPLVGPSNGFIAGWNEVLGEMKVCEARTLYIKPELAYGANDRGPIPGNSLLVFNMQLLAVAEPSTEDNVSECPEGMVLAGPDAY